MPTTPNKMIGARIKRREDPRLITGRATYVDDLQLPGMLHMSVARSMYAHAKLVAVDVSKAKTADGVVAAFTGADLEGKVGDVPCAVEMPDLKVPPHPVLARGTVRHVGEAVAVVVAENRYAARDAADLIEIDCDPLDAVVDLEKAAEAGSPLVHEQFGTNVALRIATPTDAVDQAMRSADRVVKLRIVQQRLAPLAMEPRAVAAQWDRASATLTVWSSTQIPHILRLQLAEVLRLDDNRIRVVAPEVGGGFGAKLNVYAEEILAAWLARELGRPVKWTQARREDIAATTQGRGQVQHVEAAVKKDGTITALRAKLFVDYGAYFQLLTPVIPTFTGLLMQGAYRIPAIAYEIVGVFTNKMATDAYRGAGRPEAAFIAERMMDTVAAELGLDPAEVRRKNFVPKDAFPYTNAGGAVYDSGDYERALDKALENADYAKLRKEQAELRKLGRYLGIGLSSYIEICGLGPSSGLPPKLKTGGWESSTVRVDPSGTVTVLTGISPHGQGQETSFAQIAADALGVDFEKIVVLHGDTAMIPYGVGTFGSRGTALGGTALRMSLEKIQTKMRTIASAMMEAPPESLEFGGGRIFLKGQPDKGIPFKQVSAAAHHFGAPVPGIEPGLDATSYYEPSGTLFPFGTHVAVVEVDPETGGVELRRFVAVDDCGSVINPLLVEGQVHGGIAQGLAQALYEEVIYDENGQLVTGSLMDYAVPKSTMVPRMELDSTVTPTPVNPLGVKGVGEAGTIGSTPAIVNAVLDALAPFGIRHLDMPLWPEKIWRAIRASGVKENRR